MPTYYVEIWDVIQILLKMNMCANIKNQSVILFATSTYKKMATNAYSKIQTYNTYLVVSAIFIGASNFSVEISGAR